ncbi:MAG: helix-turn-helix domain-containing protein [Rhodocyclaceae bacterium]|nr:helix-turn-helix domain-containing protein [Rhodocyclaceae bacterium]
MSISALNWAFGMRGVSVSQKVVLISLANFSDENGYSFPSMKTIADMSCMSESSVRRALSEMCAQGILTVEKRFRADGSQTSSGYFLVITPPVNLTPPPCTVTPPPVTADTPYNHHITTTLIDTGVSISSNKRGSRISENWKPSQDDYNQALHVGLTVEQIDHEANKFRDYWISKAGKDAVKLNWSATWRNWCRTAKDRSRAPSYSNTNRDQQKSGSRVDAALRALQASKGGGAGW